MLVLVGGGISDLRGSVSGTTFSRSKAGVTGRCKTSPVNPRTPKMGLSHNRLVRHSRGWSNTLTAADRTAWNLWALTMPQTNVFGQTVYISGQAWYTKLNNLIEYSGGAPITVPPLSATMPGFLTFTTDANATGVTNYHINVSYPALPGTPVIACWSTWTHSPGIKFRRDNLRLLGMQAANPAGAAITYDIISLFNSALPDAPFYTSWSIDTMLQIIDNATGAASAPVFSSCILT